MYYSPTEDAVYVRSYSAEVYRAVLEGRRKQLIHLQRPELRGPITDNIEIPTPEHAGHDLFMAAMAYYRRSGDMPKEARETLIALQQGIHDPRSCLSVLNDALLYFVHSMASVQDAGVRNAIKMAQLSLKSLQSTWAEMPATTAEWHSQYWLRQ